MVKYATWVSVVWDSAKAKGIGTPSFEESQDVTGLAAEVWNDRKDEIKTASEAEAKEIADDEVVVA